MEAAFYLIIPTIFFGVIVIGALVWAIKNKQYDDISGAATRILHDDDSEDANN